MEQAVNIPPILAPNPVPTMPQQQSSIPTSSTGGIEGTDTLSAILGQVAQQASAKLPPQYIPQGQPATPYVRENTPYAQKDEHVKPMTNQATSISGARSESAWNKLANVVGKAGAELQKRKSDLLKNDIQKVMQSQQNIANAQAVLANDPNNEMAKKVLEQNKTNMESILSDPKKQKQMAKAFDVSFIDPEKNKTPEHQAMQAAVKAVKDAGAFNSNNPDEHKVAEQSKTPNSDKLIAKSGVGIQENPQYTAAYKQQQDAQKQLNQYVLPKVIQAESAKELEKFKSNSSYQREQLRSATQLQKDLNDIAARKNINNDRMSNALRVQSQKDSAAMARTTMAVNARLEVAKNKQLDPATQDKLKAEAMAAIDKDINTVTTTQKQLAANMQEVMTNDKENTDRQKQIQMLMDYNDVHLAALSKYREETAVKAYGRVGESRNAGSTSSAPISVGSSASDESEDDNSDEDSDDY